MYKWICHDCSPVFLVAPQRDYAGILKEVQANMITGYITTA